MKYNPDVATPIPAGKEVNNMSDVIDFIISVMASVIRNYIYKWLNRDNGNQPEE